MTTPHPGMSDGNGWIEWAGGECPVSLDALVEVKFRDGMTEVLSAGEPADCAGSNWWQHEGASYAKAGYGLHHADIVAYRRARGDLR